MLTFAILFCLYRSNWAGARGWTAKAEKLYKRLAQSSGIEQLLYQCMEEGELAHVTLKSRRIYIGMIHTATLEYEKTANIVLIPMLSGYRDGKTCSSVSNITTANGMPSMTLRSIQSPKAPWIFAK